MASRTQINKFIDTLGRLAQAECKKRKALGKKWVIPSVCIAQAALETGWGTSSLMVKANAYFGIKWTKGCGYKAYNSKTREVYDGNSTTITAAFRAYNSLEESVADYFDLITGLNRYKAACNQTDARATIKAIKDGGYATDPNYVASVMSIIEKYNLTQYDNISAESVEYYPKYTGNTVSIVTALQELHVDSNFSFRQKIAKANDIVGYKGTAAQNTKLLKLLKEGKLIKA